MIDKDVAYLLAQCGRQGIDVSADDYGSIVLSDARDEHSFKQLAGSLGWRPAGSGISRNGHNVDVSSKEREPAQRRSGYGTYTA